MAFTEKKFASLSRTNKLKKTVVAIKHYLEEKKEVSYIIELLDWLEKYEQYRPSAADTKANPAGLSDYDWGMIIQTLLIEIGNQSSFTEDKPFDDRSEVRKVFKLKLILDNIRSPFNVGSIIRSSESFGVNEVILTGFTPGPGANSKVNRTAMNAALNITEGADCLEVIPRLRKEGYRIGALEKNSRSTGLQPLPESGLALILGNEEFGISDEILAKCDDIYHIRLFGAKNSLNVSVATGIALHELTRNL